MIYCTADNVGNGHEMIVHDICKVIGWEAITFHDDEVILRELLPIHAIHNVVNSDGTGTASKPNSVCLAICSPFSCLGRRYCQASAGIHPKHAIHLEGLLVVCRQVIVGAEAAKCLALLQQTVGMLSIYTQTLRLWSRSVS